MKRLLWLLLALVCLTAACQARSTSVTILDGDGIHTLTTTSRLPSAWLAEAGISLGPQDRLLVLGRVVLPDQPLAEAAHTTLTIRQAVTLTVVTLEGTGSLTSAAATVGEALAEAGIHLSVADRIDPPAGTPLYNGLRVTYQGGRDLLVTTGGTQVHVRSASATVGEALAEAGLPLVGLDYSIPPESEPLPADGSIRLVRIVEAVALTQTSLPYTTRSELTAELDLDQQEIIQIGQVGLAISRARVRYEDGLEVSRTVEAETTIRPPQDQVTGYGTRITIRTITVDGVTLQYWRALRVYATSYSPCRSGVEQCLYYTSLRTLVRQGEVAMTYSWWLLFAHEQIYVPGYGPAVVEDATYASYPPGNHYWIDLGYTDENWVPWSGWVTIYFLPPVPANPGYLLP